MLTVCMRVHMKLQSLHDCAVTLQALRKLPEHEALGTANIGMQTLAPKSRAS